MIGTGLIKNYRYIVTKGKNYTHQLRWTSGASGDKDANGPKSNKGSDTTDDSNLEIPFRCAVLNPSSPSMYDIRKYSHSLPCDSVTPQFETLPNIPTGIFRCTIGERLGCGANKCSYYRNPEYFSFHHMTYYDMHISLRAYRQPSAKTGRKP